MKIYAVNQSGICNENTKLLDFIYLHGTLETKNGFDLVSVDDVTYDALCSIRNGEINVFVVIGDDTIESTLYIWQSCNRRRGLIVANDDNEGIEFANNKYMMKCPIL